MLVPFAERTDVESVGTTLELEPGYYKVKADDCQPFDVVVDGKIQMDATWNYYCGGTLHEGLKVSYEINLDQLGDAMIEGPGWNTKYNREFRYLPDLVEVDSAVRSLEAQLAKVFSDIGGDTDDRQAYADFLVSFPQKAIQYPKKNTDAEDMYVWGVAEYWAKPIETLFFKIGDCEDTSALACSLFKAAGYKSAMVGVSGHVTAAVSLDSFTERNLEDYKTVCSTYSVLTVASGYAYNDRDGTGRIYYGVDTIKGQVPVGYMTKGNVDSFGKTVRSMGDFHVFGVAGFYPVP